MKLEYEQEDNGMYKLYKPDFDDIALMLLREYFPSLVDLPGEIDVNYLVKDCFYLDMYSKNLSADKSVLGLIAFSDTRISCYDLRFSPYILDLKEGNIVIDLSLSGRQQLTRRKFTIAHELSHWILHRSYHSPTNQQYEFRRESGFLPCSDINIESKKKKLETESDREEWQANSLAAAILMPKMAFLECAYQEIHRQLGCNYNAINQAEDSEIYKNIIRNIAGVFNVSFQATEIRLDQLNLIV